MASKFEWNGKKFTLSSKFSPARLFWGADTVLEMEGQQLLKASGSGFTADDETKISNEDGAEHHIHLNVHSKLLSLGYSVRVNGEEVSSGIIHPENGLIAYPLLIVQGVVFFYVFSRILSAL